jgi:hypothetical protein
LQPLRAADGSLVGFSPEVLRGDGSGRYVGHQAPAAAASPVRSFIRTPRRTPPPPPPPAAAVYGDIGAPGAATPWLLLRAMELTSPHAHTHAHRHPRPPPLPLPVPPLSPLSRGGGDGQTDRDDDPADDADDEVQAASRLVRRCRRYLRKLRATACISKAYRAVRRMHHAGLPRRMLARWRHAWQGRAAAAAAYHARAGRRALTKAFGGWAEGSLRRWQRQRQLAETFVQFRCLLAGWKSWQRAAAAAVAARAQRARLEHCRGEVATWVATGVKRRFLAVWRGEAVLRARGAAAANVAARYHKRRALASWAAAAAVARRGHAVATRHRHYLGRAALRQWLAKTHQRRLLRRVFAVRELTQLLHVQRLGSPAHHARTVLHAWRAVARSSADARRIEAAAQHDAAQIAAADAFRRATLQAAVFVRWADQTVAKVYRRHRLRDLKTRMARTFVRTHFALWRTALDAQVRHCRCQHDGRLAVAFAFVLHPFWPLLHVFLFLST